MPPPRGDMAEQEAGAGVGGAPSQDGSEPACPEEDALLAFLEGTLPQAAAANLEAHLDRCPSCVRGVARAAGGLEPAPRGLDAALSTAPLTRGAALDRYVVLDPVGAGAMGLVYAAFDPELDRKVALKLLRPDARAGDSPEQAAARMLREARALARLSHPNVITVFDVGTIDEQVFIAMEYIDGDTLGRWLREAPRSTTEIMRAFAEAGRGLAAAHGAGLVHRDFKPDNVLMGRDGRVLVTDFGLARPTLVADESAPENNADPLSSADPSGSMTRSGVMVGTPAYMAPEQRAHGPVDGRADQFAFCVALYEALYGERPFAGATPSEIAGEIALGRVRPAPKGARVPPWLRSVLLQGLAHRPEARHASMEALLEALRRDPQARLRQRGGRALAALMLVSAGATFTWIGARGDPQPELCRGAEERLAGVWDPARRSAVEAALLGLRAPFARDTAAQVVASLDRYAAAWASMHREACAATRIRGEQSEDLLDLRMVCLDARRAELRALVSVFEGADVEVAQRAQGAASSLTPVEDCADLEQLASPVRLPRDPQLRDGYAAARDALARVSALSAAGKHADAIRLGVVTASTAAALGHAPLEAEVLLTLGGAQNQKAEFLAGEETLHRALHAAEIGQHDRLRARTLVELIFNLGHGQWRFDDVRRLTRMGEALVVRFRDDRELAGDLHRALAATAMHRFEQEVVLRHLRLARELYEAGLTPAHPKVLDVRLRACWAHGLEQNYEAAEAECQGAIDAIVAAYGPEHPEVARGWANLAAAAFRRARYPDMEAAARQAIAINERSLDDPDRANTAARNALGLALLFQRRFGEARAVCRDNVAIRARLFGPDHASLAPDLSIMAISLTFEGRHADAIALGDRALAVASRPPAPGDASLGRLLINQSVALRRGGQAQRALREIERALAISEAAGPDGVRLPYTLQEQAEVLLALNRPKEALEAIERALALLDEPRMHRYIIGDIHFTHARALLRAGRGRRLALSAARRAEAIYEPLGHLHLDSRAEIQAWIARHDRPGVR